jgi:exopolysaccharide biosynthesis operon protein EpsL
MRLTHRRFPIVRAVALLAPAGVAALLLAPALALALGNDTVFVRGFASATYDSNVFRLADELDSEAVLGDRQTSDLYWGVGAGIRLDVPVSQQRFTADASVTEFYYSEFDQLDYTGYGLSGAWDWRAGERWSGRLNAGLRQERQAYSSDLGIAIPRLMKTYNGNFQARYELTPRWELQGQLDLYRVRLDSAVFERDDFDSRALSFGAAYRTPLGNSTGVRLRYEEGEWPNRTPSQLVVFGDEYEQYTLSAVVDWRPTGRSRLYGDAGYTWRDRTEASGSDDFDGPSGRLSYDYYLSGKSTLKASLYQTRGAVDDLTASYTTTTGIDLSFLYRLGGKTQLEATASYRDQEYEGTAAESGIEQREDKITELGLGASYELTRTMTLSAGARYETRSSNIRFGDYDAYILSLTGSIEF